jgi:proteasome accessory factor C
VSVEEVAREFGVSPRTIRRDVNVLLFCGLPGLGMGDLIDVDFEALEGEDVIRLSNADYLARPLRLDSTEAAALVAGLRALLEGSEGPEREVLERTLGKVEAAAGEAAGVASQVELLPEVDHEQDLRERLSGAVAERRQVRLMHESSSRDELTTRVVDPVALTTVEGHTYLDAWCHLVEDRRLFRLDRIAEVEVLHADASEHAALPPLDLSHGIFRPAPDALLATVRLSSAARWVSEYYPVESVAEEADGGLTIELRVADPGWLVRLMLRLGGSASLVSPKDLGEQVRRTAQAALGAYL